MDRGMKSVAVTLSFEKEVVKGETIPNDFLLNLRELFSLRYQHFNDHIILNLCKVTEVTDANYDCRLHGLPMMNNALDALGNTRRLSTIVINSPPNGRYYIALTSRAFHLYVFTRLHMSTTAIHFKLRLSRMVLKCSEIWVCTSCCAWPRSWENLCSVQMIAVKGQWLKKTKQSLSTTVRKR